MFEYLHIDQLIDIRKEARINKDYKLSDEIRDYLDSKLVFIFDHSDGFQEVWHCPESYFKRIARGFEFGPESIVYPEVYFKYMKKDFLCKRKYIEYKKEVDRLTDKSTESWLYSQFKSMGYDDEYCEKNKKNFTYRAPGYYTSWEFC